ncbi:aldehyde dehydrogenase (plasmid) [Rhodococcus erythropolis R138]|uniref:aldehyde dehydrogenase family protein n=1 Tax=Rhodococcus erythropolis TaxID=1833 RepID=UPI000492B023|nr:aldehyde dehydrogenase family protein [Rhodococcus erythropolis]ALU73325.1 aldehyde dehydrogenase [Rhodococcus erythropolis R138]
MTGHHFDQIYIGGAWVDPVGGDKIPVVNPATESTIGAVPAGTVDDVNAAVDAAKSSFPSWWRTPVEIRAGYLRAVAEKLTARRDEIALLISSEMGSPVRFSSDVQVSLPVNSFLEAASVAESFEWEAERGNSIIVREPVGVVGAITPWNYPLHQIAGKVAYALAAGNTIVVKPSEESPLNAWVLAEIMDEVGVPPGVFNLVSGTGLVVGEALASHPDVELVTFTGSTRAGIRVGELAAKTIKRVTLELGGKSANLILPGTDLSVAIPHAIDWAFINSGQTCLALTRLLVHRDDLRDVELAASALASKLSVGAPDAPSTDLGPLVSEVQMQRVRKYIEDGIRDGARLIAGGSDRLADLPIGYYVRPTILSDVTPNMSVFREEIFGPVLSIVPYDSIDEGVRIANNSMYGLAGSVWSNNSQTAREIANQIRTGQIMINGGEFNPNAPFGGYKQSGIGREFGPEGLSEFLEIKSFQY